MSSTYGPHEQLLLALKPEKRQLVQSIFNSEGRLAAFAAIKYHTDHWWMDLGQS